MRKLNVGAAAIAVATLVVTLVPSPAPASAVGATPAGSPERLTEAQECGDVKALAAGLAAVGGPGVGACVQTQAAKVGQIEADPTGAASPDAMAGPAIAAAGCGSASYKTRSGACQIEDGLLVIFLVPNGQVIGTIEYTVWGILSLHHNSLDWVQSFNYRANVVSGATAHPAVTGTEIYAEPLCLTSCTVVSSGLVGGSALPGHSHFASTTFRTPAQASGLIWHPQSAWKWWFFNPAWTPTTSNTSTTSPGSHRCDDTLGRSAGCVYSSVRPVHDIGKLRWPMYARHIELALNHNLPRVLTRTTSAAVMNANRGTACPDHYPRPDNHQCDEYPFASTYNGAASQPYGRTFLIIGLNGGEFFNCRVPLPRRQAGDSGGYSVCMIPADENRQAGVDLGEFYYQNRVIDQDQFEVRVVY